MILYFLIAFVFVIILLVTSPIRFRFQLDRAVKMIQVSYLLAKLRIDPVAMEGQIRLAGFRIKTISAKDLKKSPVKKEIKKKKPAVPKKAGKIKFQWSDLSFVISFLKIFHIKTLLLTISGGLSDPFETGKYFGIYTAFCGALPSLMSHIIFRPDFGSEKLEFAGKGHIYIRPYQIIFLAIRILFKKSKMILGEAFLFKKKGASYA